MLPLDGAGEAIAFYRDFRRGGRDKTPPPLAA
jgi:hypothetical protein